MDGAVTPDGSPVEVYTLLPPAGEPEIIHAALPAGATVLDLGCGTGRVAHPLIELGHPVVAVDDSPQMLAHVRGAETVCARIEDLRLERRFDGVLLASHLINMADDDLRGAVLATAHRHLADDGCALIQWHPPGWFDTVAEGPGGLLGEVRISLHDVSRNGNLLSASVRYEAADSWWTQSFTARRFDERELHEVLAEAGLSFDGWHSCDHTWFAARHHA